MSQELIPARQTVDEARAAIFLAESAVDSMRLNAFGVSYDHNP